MTDESVAAVILQAGGLDVSACETAGLAHDLGHPPFGHAGEAVLDRLLRRHNVWDGFEGNAQSFRIVTRLDLRSPGVWGLGLTNVTLAAIQKYPYTRKARATKFGAYESEGNVLEACRKAVLGEDWESDEQTLEASIMDLADDIAYAVHDLEDFLGAGVIDIRLPIADLEEMIETADVLQWGRITSALRSLQRDMTDALDGLSRQAKRVAAESDEPDDVALSEAMQRVVDDSRVPIATLGTTLSSGRPLRVLEASDFSGLTNPFAAAAIDLANKYAGYFEFPAFLHQMRQVLALLTEDFPAITRPAEAEYSATVRKELSSVVGEFFENIQIASAPPYPGGPRVHLSVDSWHFLQCLKVITRRYLVSSPRMGIIQQGQAAAITSLFHGLAAWLSSGPDPLTVPAQLKEYIEAQNISVPVRDQTRPTGVSDEAVDSTLEPALPDQANDRETFEEIRRGYKPLVLDPKHYRAISDYICGMSDSEALLRSQWLTGIEIPGMTSLGVQVS